MENLAKSYLCMVVPFSANILAFYRQNPNHQDPGEIRGANAPPNSPTSRGNAARAAFPRPGCGQVATPCWSVSPVSRSAFIFSWFSRLIPGLWRNGLWFLALTDRFWEDSSQPVSNLLILPWFTECELILISFRILVGFGLISLHLLKDWACK